MNHTPYVPVKGDFEFLAGRDIATDQNFASRAIGREWPSAFSRTGGRWPG